MYRQLQKYDGTTEGLKLKSRKPHSQPRQYSVDELQLIRVIFRKYKKDGKAEIYAQLTKRDYRRSYGSLCVQLRKLNQR